MPSRLIFPVGVHHVKQMIALVGLTISQRRDMLICALGTVMCMRLNEVDQLQVQNCDVLWRFDAGFHVMYTSTLACRIYKRKQDTAERDCIHVQAGPSFRGSKLIPTCLGSNHLRIARRISHQVHAVAPVCPSSQRSSTVQ